MLLQKLVVRDSFLTLFYIHHTDLFIFLHTVQYSNTLVFLQKTLKFLPTLYGLVIFFADIGQKLQYQSIVDYLPNLAKFPLSNFAKFENHHNNDKQKDGLFLKNEKAPSWHEGVKILLRKTLLLWSAVTLFLLVSKKVACLLFLFSQGRLNLLQEILLYSKIGFAHQV